MEKLEKVAKEIIHGLVQNHVSNEEKFSHTEAFNIAADIRITHSLPEEEKTEESLAEKFSVDPSQEFEDIYLQIVEKLEDPSFQR